MTVHPVAAAGWREPGAADYERGRPGYPRAAVELIGAELGVGPGTTILDLAAGTGKLTRELSSLGADVIAVEPLPAMRAELAAAVPGADVREGSAEAIPAPDGSVRAVTVAQAFHWFDVPAAAAEIARVLEPGGGLAIVRNEWRTADATAGWAGAMGRHLDGLVSRPATHDRDWRSELDDTGRFGPFAERVVPNPHAVDLDELLLRIASMSFVAALPDDRRAELLAGARTVLLDAGLSPDEPVLLPERTIVRWAVRS